MSADERRTLRRAEALPILARIKARFEEVRPTLRPTSKLAPPNAASRCWKPHFRRLSNDLISEMAISESPCREIRQNGEQSVGLSKNERLLTGCCYPLD